MPVLDDIKQSGTSWRLVATSLMVALVGGGIVMAQTMTVNSTPAAVNPERLEEVVLTVVNGVGQLSSTEVTSTVSVTVGGRTARVLSKDPAIGIRIMPPELQATGRQPVRLLDAENKLLAEGGLVYELPLPRALTFDELMRQREQDRRDVVANSRAYYWFVAGIFLLLLGPFVWAIVRGSWSSKGADKTPLGLPVGSFRSILAYSLVAYLGFYVLTSVLSVSYFNPPEFLLGVVATVVGFYFGSRSTDEGSAVSGKTGTLRGTVRQGTSPARGALVRFRRSTDSSVPYTRVSDIEGRFELSGVLPGEYGVQASLIGVPPSDEQKVAVTEGSDHELEIVIKAAAQPPTAQNGSLEITVVDPEGKPAPQAKVTVSQSGVKKAEKTTDTAGTAKVGPLPVGDYELVAALEPHVPSDKTSAKVASGESQTVTLKLKPK